MPPHALIDSNPCFDPVRWQAYVEFVRVVLGHVHEQEVEESEYDPHDDDEEEEIPELEPIPVDEYVLPLEGTAARVAFDELMEFLETL